MGLGVISISTSQKRQSGPPFTANSARNGDSVDAAGKIVLGNDVADATRPAQLLNNRAIPNSDVNTGTPFYVSWLDYLNDTEIRIDGQRVEFNANLHQELVYYQGSSWLISQTGIPGLIAAGGFDATGNWQFSPFGANLLTFNGASGQFNGSITHRRFVATLDNTSYNLDKDLDSAKRFENTNGSGAVTINAPNFALSTYQGFNLGMNIITAQTMTLQLFAGQVIRFGALSSSAGGTIFSNSVGSSITLMLCTPTTWIVESYVGVWTMT